MHLSGARLFFKCENLQKTGSFKIRGATNAIFSLTDEEVAPRRRNPHSSGNHAAAVACAARWRGTTAVDRHAEECSCGKMSRRRKLRRQNHFLRTEGHVPRRNGRAHPGGDWRRDDSSLRRRPHHRRTIHRRQGTGSRTFPDLDAVLSPVSGGGLLSGTCLGAKGTKPGLKVYGCEPERADDAYRSWKTGKLQTLESSDTIADGLRASLAPRTFAILQKLLDGILLVSEAEIVAAMKLIWERMKIVIEPSSAVALAPILRSSGLQEIAMAQRRGDGPAKVGIILSGGNVELKL